jgi:hypothetical protein
LAQGRAVSGERRTGDDTRHDHFAVAGAVWLGIKTFIAGKGVGCSSIVLHHVLDLSGGRTKESNLGPAD